MRLRSLERRSTVFGCRVVGRLEKKRSWAGSGVSSLAEEAKKRSWAGSGCQVSPKKSSWAGSGFQVWPKKRL